jgi:hypothetical protein
MALPHGTTGSLGPAFTSARPIGLAVKLPCALTLHRAIANRAERAFGLLRYLLGGDRPSQTARLALSPARIHGTGLEFRRGQSGISRPAPRGPKSPLQRLPPILRKPSQNPILGCSKGPRGLSVFPRVRGIFTTTSVSPSPSLRQCPSRYAIRAGRNLPDKGLRYLRTVIVTAAVNRCFGSERLPTNRDNPFP